jgi:23S rRNA pseudouridine1911/1915/1917 synthase
MGHRPGQRSDSHGEPGIVTRLDKDTSGVVLVALTPELHARMQRHGISGRMRKQYLAVVRGVPVPARGSIALPLARSAEDRRRVIVTDTGQASETTYEVLSSGKGHSLVRCELVTGRTHQIRVHLAARGWPVVGDAVYGTADEHMARQALHAWRVTLPHPVTGVSLEIEAAMPADMQRLLTDQNLTL